MCGSVARRRGPVAGPRTARRRHGGLRDQGAGNGRGREEALDRRHGEEARDGAGSSAGQDTERHLPFGAMGSSVAISQLDAAPLLSGIELVGRRSATRGLSARVRRGGDRGEPRGGRGAAAQLPRADHRTLGDQPAGQQGPVALLRDPGPDAAQEPMARARRADQGRRRPGARPATWARRRTGWCAATAASPATRRAGGPVHGRSADWHSASSG